MEREKFKSRLGFILISAGCAIGIGNVWRFPYVVGSNGGGLFVLLYIIFLLVLGIPIMTMEFAVGRASKKSVACAFSELEKPKTKWHLHSYMAIAGNYLLMMYYTTIAGWMFYYFYSMATGKFVNSTNSSIISVYEDLLDRPFTMFLFTAIVILLGFAICSIGLQRGVERVTKIMMLALLIIMVALAINSIFLDGGLEGMKFYLIPNLKAASEIGYTKIIVEAMNQAFFTLSIGIGSMAIFGSYLDKDRSLLGESINIALLDTFVAVVSGLIIFPACFAFAVSPNSGPRLIFITLPNVFNSMPASRIIGTLFFVFMSFAAFSTVIGVFENIMSFSMDLWQWSRKKSAIINFIIISVGAIPCILGFNVLSGFTPLGAGTNILDLEDFFVSTLFLPLGSLIYTLFCVTRYGWGFNNYFEEVNIGKGLKIPKYLKFYLTFILPLIIIFVFISGLIAKFR